MHQAVLLVQPDVGKAHMRARLHLVLSSQPLAQPPERVSIYRGVSGADLSEVEVVRQPVITQFS